MMKECGLLVTVGKLWSTSRRGLIKKESISHLSLSIVLAMSEIISFCGVHPVICLICRCSIRTHQSKLLAMHIKKSRNSTISFPGKGKQDPGANHALAPSVPSLHPPVSLFVDFY